MQMNLIEMLSDRGVFVTRNIGLYRGNKKLEPKDLGLNHVPKGIRLGHLALLPEEICPVLKEIEKIGQDVGNYVKDNTHDFCRLARFVPQDKLDTMRSHFEIQQDEFAVKVDEFLGRYEEYINASVEHWKEKASELGVSSVVLEQAIRDAFPDASTVRSKFEFRFAFIPLATMKGVNKTEELVGMCDSFLEETFQKFRQEALAMMADMGKSIAEGKWNQKTLNRVTNMIDSIKGMSLVPDDDLVQQLESFKARYCSRTAKDYKDSDSATRELRSGLSAAVDTLKRLADEDCLTLAKERFTAGAGRKLD